MVESQLLCCSEENIHVLIVKERNIHAGIDDTCMLSLGMEEAAVPLDASWSYLGLLAVLVFVSFKIQNSLPFVIR